MSLSVSAIFPCTPVNSTGMRTEKSPFFMEVSVRNNNRSKSRGETSVALSTPMPVVMPAPELPVPFCVDEESC